MASDIANGLDESIPIELRFPKTINYKIWGEYLGRNLNNQERYLLEDYRAEKYMNNMMKQLYIQCNKKNLFVPMLTNLDGNCLFESLVYHDVASSVMEIRDILSLLLYVYKDYKGFLPNNDVSLEEMFNMTNEIEYVSRRRKVNNEYVKDYYKYTYNVMCQDLTNNHSWSRLPTQIILMVLSYVYKLEFIIVGSNNDYENKVNVYENIPVTTQKIYLGHLGESHYVPLDILTLDYEIDPLFYKNSRIALIEWAESIEKMKINKYLQSLKLKELETKIISESDENKEELFQTVDLAKLDDANNEVYMVDFSEVDQANDDQINDNNNESDKAYMVYF